MVDAKPPRLAADERDTLLTLLQFQRSTLVRKATGIGDDEATSSPVASGTTLAWLVAHMAEAETIWIEQRFAGLAATASSAGEPTSCAAAISHYGATWRRTDRIVAAATLEDTCRGADTDPPVTLRWILAHLLEETARHAGPADILRELIDGETGR